MNYSLTLTFLCANGEKSSVTVDNVDASITKEQVTNLMDTIISKNIFLTKNGEFTGKSAAKLTQKAVTKFDIA